MGCHYILAPFWGEKRKKEQADAKKEQVVCEMKGMGKIEEIKERYFRTGIPLLTCSFFGVKKRKKEQANVKKEQVVYAMK